MRVLLCLIAASLFLACQQQTAEEKLRSRPLTETSNGKEGVGSTGKPVRKEIHGIRFQQKGLEIENAEHYVDGGAIITPADSVRATDTALMPLYIRGWHAPDGIARIKVESVVRRPDGSIAHQMNTLKEVFPFDISQEAFNTMAVFTDLDTTLPYYDYEFTILDVGNGRSLTGGYQYKFK